MSPLLTSIVIGLVVMSIPPILAAGVLWRASRRHTESVVLRERWQLSAVLAAQAVIVAVLALNRLLSLGLNGELLTLPLAIILLLVDLASGRWLWQWWTGHLLDEPWVETPTQAEDREAGVVRRAEEDEHDAEA